MTGTVPTTQATAVATGYTFLEGPRWHGGALFVSDFYSGRVLEFRPDVRGAHDVREVCTVPGRPSGLGFAPDGSLWIVSMLQRAVLRWDGATLTEVSNFRHLIDGFANDMIVLPSGWAFVGNFGNSDREPDSLLPTDLVRISPDGDADLADVSLVFPNGFVDTGTELVVAETFAGRLSAFTYSNDHTGGPMLHAQRTWKQFGTPPTFLDIPRAAAELEELPDGLALDASGAIWVASSNGHLALRISPDGELLEAVDAGDLSVYALALGGPELNTLYLCCSPALGENDPSMTTDSVLMTASVTVPGAAPAHHRFGETRE